MRDFRRIHACGLSIVGARHPTCHIVHTAGYVSERSRQSLTSSATVRRAPQLHAILFPSTGSALRPCLRFLHLGAIVPRTEDGGLCMTCLFMSSPCGWICQCRVWMNQGVVTGADTKVFKPPVTVATVMPGFGASESAGKAA